MIRKQRVLIIIVTILSILFFFAFKNAIFTILSLLVTSSILAYLILPFIKHLEKRVPKTIAILTASP